MQSGGGTSSMSFKPFSSEQQGSGLEDMCGACPKLTYQQRIIGFVCCAGLGYLLSFMGTLFLLQASAEGLRAFIALYIVGNFIALAATLFLIGPASQCKKMWHETRRFSTAFYLIMLIIVFAVAVAGVNVFVVLFLLLIEICAGMWYFLSYIPYGRKAVLGCLKAPCKDAGGGSG
mmetsp:Transcript_9124/g.31128  ORF Transcript_9124/g.31128 Transcript_9124/m.31128 type:complete len:175 (-) Transcript_9124:30-554(-)|eukprot:CAMPEP_0198430948 /NCGR_PEP_ID=MMETSP1452-20131203/16627_1 /TAXON_ID=1181717 /ORGANISM="Synchroma pusillum, Strain CCMP3072" /LENGTH=174 /DNA_ID=CAMNT_0044151399 /DNA_START=45 /DNA_END=569 /DNA_ORIENTATION=+